MKKSSLACLLVLSSLVLTACPAQPEVKPDDDDEKPSEKETKVDGLSGKKANYDEELSFATDSPSQEGEVIHLEVKNGKSTVYYLGAGEATLVSGSGKKYEFTVRYSLISGTGVNAFGFGDDYAAFKEGILQTTFRGSRNDAYLVGTKNPVKLDIGFTYETFVEEDGEYVKEYKVLNIDEAKSLKYFNQTDSVSIEIVGEEAGANYGTVNEDLTISLSEYAIGKELSLKVSSNGKSVQQDVKVNGGYNVYCSDDLKQYFENPAVNEINILRSFEIEYKEENVFKVNGETYLYNTVGDLESQQYQGSIYYRFAYGETSLTVNGNYMVLDGTKLPLHFAGDKNESGLDANVAETQAEKINGLVVNPQEAIFRTFTYSESNQSVKFNNMNLRGNSNTGTVENPETSSAGLIGLIAKQTDMEIENCVLDYNVYGVAGYSQNATVDLKDSVISNTWGSSITTWRSHEVNVRNSLLTKAGSAAVWLINNPREGQQGNLLIDEDSVVDNYLSPSSGWFVAYQLNTLNAFVDTIEYSLNTGAQQANAPALHTLFKGSDKTLNFVVLVQNDSEQTEQQYKNPYANITIANASATVDIAGTEADFGSDMTNNKFLLYGIKSGAGSIILPFGIDHQIFAETMRTAFNTMVKGYGLDPDIETKLPGQIVQTAAQNQTYAQLLQGAFAYALSACLAMQDAAQDNTYIEIDATISGMSVGTIIEVNPVA